MAATRERQWAVPRWLTLGWVLLVGSSLGCGDAKREGLFADRAALDSSNRLRSEPGETPALDPPRQAGSEEHAELDPAGTPSPGDSVAGERTPQVLWTEPSDGQLGVRNDASVVVQFDREMNPSSVAAALESSLPGTPTLSWDRSGTTLRINVAGGLPYAEGEPGDAPLQIRFSLSEGATDVDGDSIEAFEWSFSTFIRTRVRLLPVGEPRLTGTVWSQPIATDPEPSEDNYSDSSADAGILEPDPDALERARQLREFETLCDAPTTLCVGDGPSVDGRGSTQLKAFASFDLSTLPAQAEIEWARLSLQVADVIGGPFGQEGLGELHAERSFLEGSLARAFRADPDATLAVLREDSSLATSENIHWVVSEARSAGLSHVRLTFPQTTDGDDEVDVVVFDAKDQELEISYLLP